MMKLTPATNMEQNVAVDRFSYRSASHAIATVTTLDCLEARGAAAGQKYSCAIVTYHYPETVYI